MQRALVKERLVGTVVREHVLDLSLFPPLVAEKLGFHLIAFGLLQLLNSRPEIALHYPMYLVVELGTLYHLVNSI